MTAAALRVGDADSLPHVFLAAERMVCTARPTLVTTVLGSCVALVLWDAKRQASGINHFVLPQAPPDSQSLRYGDVAIDRLVAAMQQLGCQPADLEGKLFGGAAVIPGGPQETAVGARNLAMAVERLKRWRIPVVAQMTGGSAGLFIQLWTATGIVMVRRVSMERQP